MVEKMKITFTGGGNLGEELSLMLDTTVLVGRSHSAAIRFRESDVSGKHLEISRSGDGVMALNTSRYKAMVNGMPLQPGESCPVNPGDVFALGSKARFRIDSFGVSGDSPTRGNTDGGADGATLPGDGETKAMTQGGTFATRMPNSADTTYATRPAPSSADATFATRMPSKSFNSTFATRPAPDAEVITASAPPSADPDATGMISTGASSGAAGFADTPTGMLDPSTQTGASEADGATQLMQTRAGSMDEIERHKKLMAQKKRVRRSLMAASAVIFLAMLGLVVWIRWPKAEMWLTVPKISGSDRADVGVFTVKTGGTNAFVVDYPNAEGDRLRRTAAPDASEIFVSTFTGRDRDVPFRLEVSQSSDRSELRLSLEESAKREMSQMEDKLGFVFLSPAEWQEGCLFFESEYPGSCPSPRLMRGTRFFRSEYEVTRENLKWHGVFFLFRNGITVFIVKREIPASQWPRGKWLLRKDPNIQIYPVFSAERWESPGVSGLQTGYDAEFLMKSVKLELESPTPRVAEWPRVKRFLDTLVVENWDGRKDRKDAVLRLLHRFRHLQDMKYVEFRNEFELARRLGRKGQSRMRSIRADCKSVFGKDVSDRRFFLVGDPETWSCEEKK